MVDKLQLVYFVISETELDSIFPSTQFHIGAYEIKNRRNRGKNVGGLTEYVKKGIITKKINDLETNLSETICSEKPHLRKDGFA